MILAGIDEAGYGPVLGPLVVGCCAFHIEDLDPSLQPGNIPCIWSRLKRVLSKHKSPTGKKLHVNDSKAVYSPSTGIKELERSILALAAALHCTCNDLDALLTLLAPDVMDDLAAYSWYRRHPDEKFPLTLAADAVAIWSNALKLEMRQKKAACVHLRARVICEKQLNTMLAATRNKASTLFSVTALHLDHLLRVYGERQLTIVCDRQGGRMHYAWLLRLMFDEWDLEITHESEPKSEYRLTRNGHSVRLLFWEKAEAQCLPVAAASMLGKYLREVLMTRFNTFWLTHVPGAEPTAGYYNDGLRFLQDIAPKRKELGIPDGELIRSR